MTGPTALPPQAAELSATLSRPMRRVDLPAEFDHPSAGARWELAGGATLRRNARQRPI